MENTAQVINFPNKTPDNSAPPLDLTSFNELHLPLAQFKASKAWVRGRRRNMAIAGAAFALFMAAFHQWPSGTLPDDDDFLAEASGLGDQWDALRTDVLLDWTLQSGRWWFPLSTQVAEKALSAKQARVVTAKTAADARWGKHRVAKDDDEVPF